MADNDDDSNSSYDMMSSFSSARTSLCEALRSLIVNNIDYFRDNNSNTVGERFYQLFSLFLEHLNAVETAANEISQFVSEYDYDRLILGNGYRSFVSVVDSCVVRSVELCRAVCIGRGTLLFRKEHYLKEVEAYSSMFQCLRSSIRLLMALKACDTQSASLFYSTETTGIELLLEAGDIDSTCFYGRCLGFQFCDSMRKPLKFISLAMASFSDAYFSSGGVVSRTANSIFSYGKYAYFPEERAKRIVDVSNRASVDFCKTFWLLQENYFIQSVPGMLYRQFAVNKVLQLPPEQLTLPKHPSGTSYVEIPIPLSHLPPAPVVCRLLSASAREGQFNEAELAKQRCVSVMPPSPYLVVHVHGGGFVAQSSKSHEVYLLDWAEQLNVPILCIDYSLAPGAPFPRPLEECFYAYAWVIKNIHRLGSTGEKICLVGDSAGGNLILGVTLKAIEMGIRKPDSVFALYTPVLIEFIVSPSRLLCFMDPLLPFGFMMRCLKAYAGYPSDEGCSASIAQDLSSETDVLVTDSVTSASKLVGGLKIGHEGSESDSFEEVSASDVLDFDLGAGVSSETVATVDPSVDCDDTTKDIEEDRRWVASMDSEENILFEMPATIKQRLTERMGSLTGRVLGGISGMLPSTRKNENEENSVEPPGIFDNHSLDKGGLKALIEEFHKLKVNRSHYMSPCLASDDLLKQMPPTRFLSLQLDPFLDDVVTFSKQLRSLGVQVDIDILDGLPHGFLNFVMVSKDAHDASRKCVERLREMLQLPSDAFI